MTASNQRPGARPRALLAANALTALAVLPWLTALVVAGAVVAPVVFGTLSPPSRAGEVMQPIFLRLDRLYLVLALLLLAGQGLAVYAASLRPRLVPGLLSLSLVALAAWGALVVHPEMAALTAAGFTRGEGPAWARFDALHHLAAGLGKAQVAAGLALLTHQLWAAWPRRS